MTAIRSARSHGRVLPDTPVGTPRRDDAHVATPPQPPPLPPAPVDGAAFVDVARERAGQPRPSTPPNPGTTGSQLDDPLRTGAERVLARYAPTAAAQPRAAQRLLFWVAELHDALDRAAGQPDRVAGAMHRDVRTAAFMLEATLRLYRGKYGEPFNLARKEVKALEDALGALGHAQDMKKAGASCADLPAGAAAYLDRQVDKKRDELVALLDGAWTPDARGQLPALARVVETATATGFRTGAADREIVRGALLRQLDELAAGDLDMSDLQGGLHELRRQLRWVPIYGMAVKGAVVLDDTLVPEPRYAALRDDPVASSPFATLPTSAQDKNPLRLSRTVFLRCTQLVDELGQIKDRGEAIEELAKALRKADLVEDLEASEQEAARLLGQDGHTMQDIKARAAALYPEVQRLATLFADGLRSQG